MPCSTNPSRTHPLSALIRERAAQLRAFADAIERSAVMRLPDLVTGLDRPACWSGPRAELCERMLDSDVRRLLVAAEGLRRTAFQLIERADALDASELDRAGSRVGPQAGAA